MIPCQGCAYQRSIPGDCHFRCVFAWQDADDETKAVMPTNQRESPHTMQWFNFPFNYDPVWGPDECPAKTETADPANY